MSTITATQAASAATITADVVARLLADANAAERAGNLDGAAALRRIADSRARVGARVRIGARVVAA